MPFTVSHVVAVIPLYKYLTRFGGFSALVIGSMTPDFAYLTPFLVDQRVDSHTLLGIYLFCIPMGLTVYFLYHGLMAPVIVSILPQRLQKHLHEDLFLGKMPNISGLVLVSSLILGAFTHIFWDFFTHQSGLPQFIHWMDIPLGSIDGYDIMPYRMLQHFSSVFGLSLLVLLIWRWYLKKEKSQSDVITNIWHAPQVLKKLSIYTLLIIPSVVGITSGLINLPETDVMYGMYSAQIFVRYAIVGSAAAFIICCVLLGLIYKYQIFREAKV